MMSSLIFFLMTVFSMGPVLPVDGTAVEQFTLTIKIKGLAPEGQAIISIFNTPKSFLKSPMRNEYVLLKDRYDTEVTISSLPAGVYAVSVVHDKNADGKLATGLFGIPTEHVGFSNNARGRFGPPSFEKASFILERSSDMEITVRRIRH